MPNLTIDLGRIVDGAQITGQLAYQIVGHPDESTDTGRVLACGELAAAIADGRLDDLSLIHI